MPGYIKATDYDYKIREEIKRLLDNSETKTNIGTAEDVAAGIIRMWIGGRVDCSFLNVATPLTGPETRNMFFVDMVIAITLFKLYGQTGTKDIPTHRQVEYDDAISWLKGAGRGDIPITGLTSNLTDDNPGEFIMNSRPPTNWKT